MPCQVKRMTTAMHDPRPNRPLPRSRQAGKTKEAPPRFRLLVSGEVPAYPQRRWRAASRSLGIVPSLNIGGHKYLELKAVMIEAVELAPEEAALEDRDHELGGALARRAPGTLDQRLVT